MTRARVEAALSFVMSRFSLLCVYYQVTTGYSVRDPGNLILLLRGALSTNSLIVVLSTKSDADNCTLPLSMNMEYSGGF